MHSNEKITLAWCDSGSVSGDFALSIFMNKLENITDVLRSKGIKIATQRQELFDAWMDEEFNDSDWILWLDSDIVPSSDDFLKLIKSADRDRYPVVSGLYFTLINNEPIPCFFTKNNGIRIKGHIKEKEIGIKGMMEVSSVGFGMLLIHRSVCTKLINHFGYKHLFLEKQNPDNHSQFIGEDIIFCEHLNEINIPIYVNTEVIPKHFKTIGVDENYYKMYNNYGKAVND